MSTTPLRREDLRGHSAEQITRRAGRLISLPAAIGLGLLAVILYAAFSHGAVSRTADTRVELAVTGLASLTLLGLLWTRTLHLRSSRAGLTGGALLAGFAVWNGVTLVWSLAPDQTWIEVNRVITDTIVLGLGIVVAASYSRGLRLVATGFLAAALIVTAYALGQKLFPGLHVRGVFSLNQTGPLTRLQEPLGYWNALALFIALGTPLALALALDQSRSDRSRLLAACALELMLVTIPFTYSRGGLLALAVALGAMVALGGERLRSGIWLGVVVLSALPGILVGLLLHQLNSAGIGLGTREWAGLVLALVVAGSLVALGFAGRWLLGREAGLHVAPSRIPLVRRTGIALVVVVLAGVMGALALTSSGLGGTLSHLWQGFTATNTPNGNDPNRLLSAVSQDRWVWWKEGAAAFSARPWGGWGAGSFPVVHLLYRQDTLPVQQPHNVPLQFLAETGLTGAVLALGAFVLLVFAGVRSVRRLAPGPERLLVGSLLAGALAYGIHCLYDWDWNIPALSLPAFLFLGVVVASRSSGRSAPRPVRTASRVRGLWLAVATVWLCILALSIELPQLAAEKATTALVESSSHSSGGLRAAQADAALAGRLDPLSDAGLLAQATIALHLRDLQAARSYLRDAVARDPTDRQALELLALVDGAMRQVYQARAAAQRAVDLDPMGQYAQTVLTNQLAQAPAAASPTRYP